MSGSRSYPDRPFVGVGAVIVDGERIVLIRRKFEPLKGQWSLPGGAVELGETLERCVEREMHEETGLDVEVGPVIEVFDRITHDAEGRVWFHYVLVDYLCWIRGGALQAGSDVDEVVFADPAALAEFALTEKALDVIARGVAQAGATERGSTDHPWRSAGTR